MANIPSPTTGEPSVQKKRKREVKCNDDYKQLEIDINAPQPTSKKVQRRAKRAKETSVPLDKKSIARDRKKPRLGKDTPEGKGVSGRSPYGIWIGNLPFGVTKKDLHEFITGDVDCAISSEQITRIHLPPGPPKPGFRFQNKGFAYVDFLSADVLERALHLSEKLVGGRRVLIKSSNDFQGRPEPNPSTSSSTASSSKRIFVGNLGFEISKENLEHHFQICGPIHDVHLATFEDSGKCKGFGWVEFEQLTSAVAAMRGWLEMDDSSADAEKENAPVDANGFQRSRKRIWVNRLGDRKLRMEFAEDKATRYKKRFGKEAHSEDLGSVTPSHADQRTAINKQPATRKVNGNVEEAKPTSKEPRKLDASQSVLSGYALSSVQKMTGAIAEGKGTKTTFE